MKKLISWLLVGGISTVILQACGDSSGPAPTGGKIIASGGGGQTDTVGKTLAPYTVLVTDVASLPAPNVTVTWSVPAGGGSVTPTTSKTDALGNASATATLGLIPGPQSVQAAVAGLSGSPVTFTSTGLPAAPDTVAVTRGDDQAGVVGTQLPESLQVTVQDRYGNGVPGVIITWAITGGSAGLSQATDTTDGLGRSTVALTLGQQVGSITLTASAAGVGTASLSATAFVTASLSVVAGGNNVPDRYGSDLWVHGNYAYTGTWGGIPRNGHAGNAVKIWQLDQTGAPTLKDSIVVPSISTVSDLEVSADGQWLVFSTEGGPNNGLWVYSLANPASPAFAAKHLVAQGLHTVTTAVINGTLYAFAARDPGSPALMIFDLSQVGAGQIGVATTVPVPANYGHHDTFVRDGIAFVFAWNTGVIIYDVGKGIAGGSPADPRELSRLVTSGGEVHNGWWFWNPDNGQQKYLFIGQEGPGGIGISSSGDIHVVDVSDLSHPVEVAFYHLPGAGTHNFWMDEQAHILYAAYYNGGVVALNVSGTLSGDLAKREIARLQPGGNGNTYTWGVQLQNGSLYAVDMLSGFWQLKLN